MSEHIKELNLCYGGRKISVKYDLDPSYTLNKEMAKWLQTNDGDFGIEIIHLLMKAVYQGDIVIDGGACVGYFTTMLSQLVGPTGTVYAFEPGENNLPWLQRNITLNNCKNVTVIEQPLWSEPSMVTLYQAEYGGGNSLADIGSTQYEIPFKATTLDKYLPAKLIKLDLEGAEAHVLSTIKKASQCPYIIAELNENCLAKFHKTQDGLRYQMQELGYQTFLPTLNGAMPVQLPANTRLACTRANVNILFSTPEYVGRLWSLIAV